MKIWISCFVAPAAKIPFTKKCEVYMWGEWRIIVSRQSSPNSGLDQAFSTAISYYRHTRIWYYDIMHIVPSHIWSSRDKDLNDNGLRHRESPTTNQPDQRSTTALHSLFLFSSLLRYFVTSFFLFSPFRFNESENGPDPPGNRFRPCDSTAWWCTEDWRIGIDDIGI